MSGVKKTIAQMKTPLDRALEEISIGSLNPSNIEELCVRYNNHRFLRTFNNTHKDCICSAVQSGSLAMVKRILNQPYYNTPVDAYLDEIEQAIHAAALVGRQDMFELLLDRGGDRVDKSRILVYTVQYNEPQLFKLLPLDVNLRAIWQCAITYNSDKIKPLLPKLTFEWFVNSLPMSPKGVDHILSTRQDFNTPERLQKIVNETLYRCLSATVAEYLVVMKKHNMLQLINNLPRVRKSVLTWLIYNYPECVTPRTVELFLNKRKPWAIEWLMSNHPEHITRDTVELCLQLHPRSEIFNPKSEIFEVLCNLVTVDFDLILCAIKSLPASISALTALVNVMKSQSVPADTSTL
tara:strand:+ start:9250 stop:10302 length:1053 start_codon:yes stop_codon:yes gene_type:complete